MSALVGLLAADWPQTGRRKALSAMAGALKGRGAEPFSSWTLENEPVGLGIRELITRDLTPDGRQPALSMQKPIAVILDGIISNANVIRRDLEEEGIKPRGYGDAELLAEAVAKYGLNRLLQKLEGAFVFALWDGQTQALHLVRDRMGAKPLFVARLGNTTVFASSPDAFEALEHYQKNLNPDSVAEYLACGYWRGGTCLLKNVTSLPPGHRLMLKADDTVLPQPESWWNPASALEEIALRGTSANANPGRFDRLMDVLATEATAIDIPFYILSDASLESKNHEALLVRRSDKNIRILPWQMPDAAGIQTAFEALSALPMPTADPDACLLAHSLKAQPDIAGSVLLAHSTHAALDDTEGKTTGMAIPRPLRQAAAKLMPSRFAFLAEDAIDLTQGAYGYWPGPENPAIQGFRPVFDRPRIPLSEKNCALFFGFEGPMRHARMPMLDAVSALYNLDLRSPLVDHRLLDYHIPAFHRSKADISGWLRGPLRIRMQKTLNNVFFDLLHIENSEKILSTWQKFLGGDNTQAQALWAWLTLAAWVSARRLT
ncbi:MAG: hypothetical protein EBQ96_05780 [Proteobacteria bacterium]|nr:hypothetical protein [Pseudomonadota bacterium]